MANQMGFAMHKDMLKAWKKEGDKTQVPRLDASKNSTYGVVSDRFLVKGDYLVFQGASFTYDLPKSLLAMASIEKASVSICGENMAQWNHRHGVNALSNFTGYTYNLYMPSKVYSININLTF